MGSDEAIEGKRRCCIWVDDVDYAEAAAAFASAKTAEDYDLVVSRHGGTPAAGNALLAKADLSEDLEGILEDVLQNTDKLQKLQQELGIDSPKQGE